MTENKIRIIAFEIFILSLLFLTTNLLLIPIFLAVDFGLRGFGFIKVQPFSKNFY